MEEKKIVKRPGLKTFFYILSMIVWTGLYELAQYLIGMYYSVQIAPEQFSEDGSYQWLKVRSQIDSAVWWIYIFVLIFLIFLLLRMWVKVGKQKMDEE